MTHVEPACLVAGGGTPRNVETIAIAITYVLSPPAATGIAHASVGMSLCIACKYSPGRDGGLMMQPSAGLALVAGDDELLRLALVTILSRSMGFAEVIEAASLDDALEMLASGRAIVLSLFDAAMPGMERSAAIGAVRECAAAAKVVVVSASSARRDILAALEDGAHGYISKRLKTAEIVRALQLVLSGSLYVPPMLAELPRVLAETAPMVSGPPAELSAVTRLEQRLPVLTPRQYDVLRLLAQGKSNKEIARALTLTEGTVKIHVATLLRALGVSNRAAAAVAGARLLD